MSSPARWWNSPVERLITSGEAGMARGALRFAAYFGVAIEGSFAQGVQGGHWDRIRAARGLVPMPASQRAAISRRNLDQADAVITVGPDAPAMVRKSGKALLAIRIRDRDWRGEVAQFVERARPTALLLAEADPPNGPSGERDNFAWSLLEAVFAAADDRDPNDGVIPAEALDESLQRLRTLYPDQFACELRFNPEPGWLPIIEQLCADVDGVLHRQRLCGEFCWAQFKQKFGRLRAYYAGGPLHVDFLGERGISGVVNHGEVDSDIDRLRRLVDPFIAKAAERCAQTCAVCGGPGLLRERVWWRTLCDLHARPGWPPRDLALG